MSGTKGITLQLRVYWMGYMLIGNSICRISASIFLVDTFCIGVKDATYYANMPECDFKELMDRYESGPGLEEISYNEAHNIIYGAIDFAEDGGIQPAKDFKIAGYILEEDTDDIPLF